MTIEPDLKAPINFQNDEKPAVCISFRAKNFL